MWGIDLDWLRATAPVFQLLAYMTLTLVSVLVAIFSAVFTYRNSFGWKPLAFVALHSAAISVTSPVKASLEFEIWNRRKYPIVVRSMELRFFSFEISPI